jgi:hypothetical protein
MKNLVRLTKVAKGPLPLLLLANEEHTYGTSIQGSLRHASEQESFDATDAPCADTKQIRLRRFHDLEQSAQGYVQANLCAHSPSGFLQGRGERSQLPPCLVQSLRVDLHGLR